MSDCGKITGSAAVLMSFLVGAALGVGLVLLLAPQKKEHEEYGKEEGPLFI